MWHMSGTVKMGRPGEADACVDRDCRVAGVRGLRVVDMSVAPLLIRYVTFLFFLFSLFFLHVDCVCFREVLEVKGRKKGGRGLMKIERIVHIPKP